MTFRIERWGREEQGGLDSHSEETKLLALGSEALPGPLRTILQGDKDIQAGASNNLVDLTLP